MKGSVDAVQKTEGKRLRNARSGEGDSLVVGEPRTQATREILGILKRHRVDPEFLCFYQRSLPGWREEYGEDGFHLVEPACGSRVKARAAMAHAACACSMTRRYSSSLSGGMPGIWLARTEMLMMLSSSASVLTLPPPSEP